MKYKANGKDIGEIILIPESKFDAFQLGAVCQNINLSYSLKLADGELLSVTLSLGDILTCLRRLNESNQSTNQAGNSHNP